MIIVVGSQLRSAGESGIDWLTDYLVVFFFFFPRRLAPFASQFPFLATLARLLCVIRALRGVPQPGQEAQPPNGLPVFAVRSASASLTLLVAIRPLTRPVCAYCPVAALCLPRWARASLHPLAVLHPVLRYCYTLSSLYVLVPATGCFAARTLPEKAVSYRPSSSDPSTQRSTKHQPLSSLHSFCRKVVCHPSHWLC
jgi:hypothetical protein